MEKKKACLMQLPLQNALLFPCPTPKYKQCMKQKQHILPQNVWGIL